LARSHNDVFEADTTDGGGVFIFFPNQFPQFLEIMMYDDVLLDTSAQAVFIIAM